MTVTIIDYGMGNIGSIANMVKKVGGNSTIASSSDAILKAQKLVLPGVGAFDTGMQNLQNLVPVLNEKVIEQKTPVLGICLGMQLLTKESEEGKLPGLGWIDAKTIKFHFADSKLKIPHMGWNTIKVENSNDLFTHFSSEIRFYFVHSFHVVCKNKQNVTTTTQHGYDFTSAIHQSHIFGVQFHPEKSHKFGIQLFKNFLEL